MYSKLFEEKLSLKLLGVSPKMGNETVDRMKLSPFAECMEAIR
jgi:hypothetical protein